MSVLARHLFGQRIEEEAGIVPALSFCVWGHPEPAGSKRAFPKRGGSGFVVVDDNPKSGAWKRKVGVTGKEVQRLTGYPMLTGAVAIKVTFRRVRPGSHFTSKGNLRPTAEEWPITRPDTTKLLRGVEDALTGVLWDDDARIVRQIVEKEWALDGRTEGVEITVWPRQRKEGHRIR